MNGTAKGTHKAKEREDKETTRLDRERTDKKDNDSKKETEKEKVKEKKEERRKKAREIEIPDDGVPYDRGWAWMIVLAGFVNFVLAAGYNRGTFIFFVNFLEEFRAPVTETALLFGVKAGINSIVGLFVMNAVVGRFGVRRTVLVGGLCLSLSAILGSFATGVTSLILSQAVFHGLGMSMLNMPTTVLLGFYFRRRRSLANSITKCGVGVGAVAFPPIVTFILNQYGLRGALLLMGGVCLNAVVAAALLRPTSFYKKRKQLRSEGGSAEKLLSGKESTDVVDDDSDKSAQRKPYRLEHRDSNGAGHNLCVRDDSIVGGHDLSARDDSNSTDPNLCARGDSDGAGNELCACKISNGADHDPCAGDYLNSAGHDLCVRDDSNGVGHDLCTDDDSKVAPLHSYVVVIEQEKIPFSSPRQKNGKTPVLSPLLCQVAILSKSAPELNNSNSVSLQNRSRTFTENETDPISQATSYGKSGKVLDALSQWSVTRYLSTPDLEHDMPCVTTPPDLTSHHSQSSQTPATRKCLSGTWQIVKKIFGVLDFSLFHSPMFRLLVVFFITSPMINAVSIYMPAMCKERGLDENQRAILLSIIGAMDFCCRLSCGFLADLKIVKVSTMIGIAFIILGVVCQLTRLLTTFPLLIGLAVMQGMLGGVSGCMMPILIMEDIGLENTAKAMGFNKLFSGAAMAAFHPLLGYIRDTTGSYDVAYNVIGAFTIVSAGVILCLRCLPHTLPFGGEKELDVSDPEESSPLHSPSEDNNPKDTS